LPFFDDMKRPKTLVNPVVGAFCVGFWSTHS
jgi:hypothetical protein